jgi:LAO/AO transport system kinase
VTRRFPPPDELVRKLEGGDRSALGRALTLVESTRGLHRALAQEVLQRLSEPAEPAFRVGISGVPGVGKSSLIETLGLHLIERGHRVAVLAVDPSSLRTGGSILADKTRMPHLSRRSEAFVRPSPSSGTLGGVARRTREMMVLCESAGFDVVLVETVGVGQSETDVAMMVDTYLVLMLAGAGDEVQGIKKGFLEWADLVAITKADGDNALRAQRAATDLRSALSIFTPASAAWRVPVLTLSAHAQRGISELWDGVRRHRLQGRKDGRFAARRSHQREHWLWATVHDQLREAFDRHPEVRRIRARVQAEVLSGTATPQQGADALLRAFGIELEVVS